MQRRFYEIEIQKSFTNLNMAQVWSAYEIRTDPKPPSNRIRGLNSNQLPFLKMEMFIDS